MLSFVKLCLLFLSMAGYLMFLTNRCRLQVEFAPALFCAGTSSLLFAAGILNFLPHMALAIYAGGFLLLACALKNRQFLPRRSLLLLAVFFLVLLYFAAVMEGAHYTSYDNFSHWATVVKAMLKADRIPNFEDFMIRFQSYPLGSSLFLYYIGKTAGTADCCLLWAQLLMLVSFLFSLAAFIQKKNWPMAFLLGLFYIWALTADNSIYELRVDTLLPLAALAAVAVITYYKEEPRKAACCTMVFSILLLMIKNSGAFFYAACLCFLIHHAWADIKRHKLFYCGTCLCAPLFALFLWKRHVALVFSDGMATKHAMSLAHYGEEVSKKSAEDLAQIGWKVIRRLVSLEHVEMKMMLLITILILLILTMPWGKKQGKRILLVLAVSWGCLAAYAACVYAMYIFSMPLAEAHHLASYDRYMLTVIIFIYGFTVISVLDAVPIPGRAACVAAAAIAFLSGWAAWQNSSRLLTLCQKPDYEGTKRHGLQSMMQRDGLEPGGSCFLCCNGSMMTQDIYFTCPGTNFGRRTSWSCRKKISQKKRAR